VDDNDQPSIKFSHGDFSELAVRLPVIWPGDSAEASENRWGVIGIKPSLHNGGLSFGLVIFDLHGLDIT